MLLGPAGFDDRAVYRNMAPKVWNTATAGTHRILVNGRFGPQAVFGECPVLGNQYGGLIPIPKVLNFRSQIAHLDPLSLLELKQLQTGG